MGDRQRPVCGCVGPVRYGVAYRAEAGRAARSYRFQTKPADMPVAPLTDDAPVDGRYALSTSLAFGGSNTALVFRKEEP